MYMTTFSFPPERFRLSLVLYPELRKVYRGHVGPLGCRRDGHVAEDVSILRVLESSAVICQLVLLVGDTQVAHQ
jgi:hypothetical protein